MRKSYQKMWVYAFFMMWLFPQWSKAEDVQKLVISKNDGTEVSFLLKDKPKITFGEDKCDDGFENFEVWTKAFYDRIKIMTDNHTMEFSSLELDKMNVVTMDVSGIANIGSEKGTMFSWNGDALYVEVMMGNANMVVYDVAGKMILSKCLGKGKHALSLSDLPKGMSIVKVNDETLKIWNR